MGHAITVLESRCNDHAGLMFELGKVTARIEDMENIAQEQNEQARESGAVDSWQEQVPVTEDHLDWLRPVLDAPEPDDGRDERHPRLDSEERMLEEMHREDREPEDYLDWWKR